MLLHAADASAEAADDKRDCIAVGRAKSATLLIDSQAIDIPAKGVLVESCDTARFQKASVQLLYLGQAAAPIVLSYDSKTNDDGHAVSERVTIGASIGALMRRAPLRRTTPVTGGQYTSTGTSVDWLGKPLAGLFTLRKVKSGETYAMVVLDPSSGYAQDTMLTDLVVNAADAQPEVQPLKLDGQACGVLWGKINCASSSSAPGFKAFMAYEEPKELSIGQTYSLSAKGKDEAQVLFVPPEYLKAHYQGEFATTQSGTVARLEKLLGELSIQTTLRNEKGFTDAKRELVRKFPHLVTE